jgi:hypothetical protein
MGALVLTGNTSGSVTIDVPAVAGANTVTIPASTGTVMVSGNMPAFSAYASAGQTLTNNVFTKVQINTEVFDTNNNFDNVTNYRFTPTVAGYYQFTGYTSAISSSLNQLGLGQLIFYKNGASANLGSSLSFVGATNLSNVDANATGLIFCNGTTDYVELYARIVGNGTLTLTANVTYFQAVLVRGA